MSYYRLELLTSSEGAEFYKEELNRSNDNAGFDLYSMQSLSTFSGSSVTLLDLGVKAKLLRISDLVEEVHYYLYPRSSIYKFGVMMANSVGIIDKTYRGPLMAPICQINENPPSIEKGNRLFQIVAPDMGWIKEVVIVSELNETNRGVGGFGSTGK